MNSIFESLFGLTLEDISDPAQYYFWVAVLFLLCIFLIYFRRQVVWLYRKYISWKGRHGFFESFISMRKSDGKAILRYPKFKWKSVRLADKKFKKAQLLVWDAFLNLEDIDRNLGIWSAEFRVLFVSVEQQGPGRYLLKTDGTKLLKERPGINEMGMLSPEKNCYPLGICDDFTFADLPLFQSSIAGIRLCAPTRYGKTTILTNIIKNTSSKTQIILVTSKVGPLRKIVQERNIEVINPLTDIAKVHSIVKQVEEEGVRRVDLMNKGEVWEGENILLVVDEAFDTFLANGIKPKNEADKLRSEINDSISRSIRLVGNANIQIIVAIQGFSVGDLPMDLVKNTGVIFSGAPKANSAVLTDSSEGVQTTPIGIWWMYLPSHGLLKKFLAFDPEK